MTLKAERIFYVLLVNPLTGGGALGCANLLMKDWDEWARLLFWAHGFECVRIL